MRVGKKERRNWFTLRMRLTLLTACVVGAAAVLLTVASLYNAQGTWKLITPMERIQLAPSGEAEIPDAIGMIPAAKSIEAAQVSGGAVSTEAIQVSVRAEKVRFAHSSLAAMILIFLGGTAAAYFISGRALAPVRKLSDTVCGINAANLSERISGIKTQDEIGSLAESFNGMLERLDDSFESQKRFAISAAHELKTPLATMMAGIQVLELDEHPSEEEVKETLEVTKHQLLRLSSLVDELLALTEVRSVERKESVRLSELFKRIGEELKEQLAGQKVSLSVEVDDELSLAANADLLYRALFNLTENAVKYNRPGGWVKLNASVREERVKITVEDSGVGMKEEELARIFEPFYRVDQSRSREVGGAGLGLAIVKDIIEKQGGAVTVESKQEKGTRFSVFFPKE